MHTIILSGTGWFGAFVFFVFVFLLLGCFEFELVVTEDGTVGC